MAVPTLNELMDELSETIIGYPDGIPSPALHMINDKGEMLVVMLAPTDSAMIAPMARLVVAKQDPAVAVLAVEGKATLTRPEPGDEDDDARRRRVLQELAAGRLKAEKREQILMIAGEDRAGNEATRLWLILPSMPGWRRRYKPYETEIVETLHSRMSPLFMFRDLMAGQGLSEYHARALARERATKEIAKMGMMEKTMPELYTPRGSREH